MLFISVIDLDNEDIKILCKYNDEFYLNYKMVTKHNDSVNFDSKITKKIDTPTKYFIITSDFVLLMDKVYKNYNDFAQKKQYAKTNIDLNSIRKKYTLFYKAIKEKKPIQIERIEIAVEEIRKILEKHNL